MAMGQSMICMHQTTLRMSYFSLWEVSTRLEDMRGRFHVVMVGYVWELVCFIPIVMKMRGSIWIASCAIFLSYQINSKMPALLNIIRVCFHRKGRLICFQAMGCYLQVMLEDTV